jgi:heme/copper-type cytochrome/quinol oxidase subunit 3
VRQRQQQALDVSQLPEYAFGHPGLMWWGTTLFVIIEGSSFVLLFVTYFFYRIKSPQWPPSAPYPALTLGTINVLLMVISGIPNHLMKRAAEKCDVRRTRVWILVCLAFGIVFLVVRWFELWTLGVMWDTNAYGSIVWVMMGIHTSEIVTDVGETAVLAALMFTAHTEPKRMVDVNENARFWDFVIVSWVPCYLLIYWAPRWL